MPVLLGSLGRIPLGMLTDRFGGRIIFSAVMFLTILPAVLMGNVHSYSQLIAYGFFIGIGLATFSSAWALSVAGIPQHSKVRLSAFMVPEILGSPSPHVAPPSLL